MTKDKDFKALVRERMAKTGESYATARANLRPDAPDGVIEPRRFEIPTWPMTGPVGRLRDRFGQPDGVDRYVEVTADEVAVCDGVGADFRLPREAIVEVRPRTGLQAVSGIRPGSHIHLMLGGGGTVVGIRLDREVVVQIANQPTKLRELRIGVDDADGLVAALT